MEQLAMNGGKKAVDWELKARFIVGKEEKAAADQLFDATIESGRTFGYSGPEEEAFGKEFATFLGAGYADGVNSGSNAVFVSLCALDFRRFRK